MAYVYLQYVLYKITTGERKDISMMEINNFFLFAFHVFSVLFRINQPKYMVYCCNTF